LAFQNACIGREQTLTVGYQQETKEYEMETNVIDAKKGVGSSMTFDMSDEEMSMMVSVGTRLSIACALTGDSVDTIISSLIKKGIKMRQEELDALDGEENSATAE
jgi:hypothetical protein